MSAAGDLICGPLRDGALVVPSLELPADMESIRRARAFVAKHSRGHGADPGAVALMTSELVTNVVHHASGPFTICVTVGPVIRVEVHDGSPVTLAFRTLMAARPTPVPMTSVGGRGLGLVHDLATRVGLDDKPDGGKVVWFEV
ncbi:ATP-binding protein [Aquihabitans sp. G128]|nr:ATP-binding protein [Aquihabitans sp. G128]